MSLPYKKDDGKRKYQCFVCGLEDETFEGFSKHIIEEHEKGREYVLCPLARCGAPVRDLKAHFAARHPQETVPGGIPHKAIVWKDMGAKKGDKMKTRKPNFRSGSLISAKNHGKEMTYRSGWECAVYECLESLNEVTSYAVEPIRIPYMFNGEIHDYLPDIRVFYNDGDVEVWEIKPSNQTADEKNRAKWAAAKEWCKTRGWGFTIVTETGIDKLKKIVIDRKRSS
jgi:hypothetical protein